MSNLANNNLIIIDRVSQQLNLISVFSLVFPPLQSGRELATLHHICVSYLRELQDLSKKILSLKTLVTVTEMLTKHKLKYREMIS